MRVLDVVKSRVTVARPNERLLDAIRRMRDEHVGALVVVEQCENGRRPVGILTDRDIVVGVFAKDQSHIGMLDVGDVMTPEPVTATSDEDVGDVLRRMRSFGVRRVPVVDASGMLDGVVTLDDIMAGLSEELASAAALVMRQSEREEERRP